MSNNVELEAVNELVDVIASLYSGKAMKGDRTELVITGHVVWLAQKARDELQAVQGRAFKSNPFADANGVGAVDVAGRLGMVERFDLDQCHAALTVPHLQATVERKVRSRIRKLEKEADHG